MGCCSLKLKKEKLEHPSYQSPINRLSISKKNFVHLVRGNLTEYYTVVKKIGDGGFGLVKLAVQKTTNVKRAIKSITLTPSMDSGKLMDEVNILKNLDHPNIVKVFEVIQDSRYLNIVMEYCSGGELFDKIKGTNGFSENIAAKYMLDIVSAVKYCHSVQIVHRDLKPENILFENFTNDARLKIIDFGTSQYFKPRERMRKFIGTSYYIAPEVINKNYDQKCDVWSLGVILYTMLCGLPPFYSKIESEIYEKIKKMPVSFRSATWDSVSDEAKVLIQKMLRKDPVSRISIDDVYSDPWLQNRAHNRVPDRPIAKEALENLQKFHVTLIQAKNNLQRITLNYIVNQLLSDEEIDELRKTFESLDKNGDGRLSREEVEAGCKAFENDGELNIDELMKSCDTDGNGYIDYTEFLTATINWKVALSNERLIAAFKVYDKDGDGKISLKELVKALGHVADMDFFTQMIKIADKNNDGEIDFDEFKELMRMNTTINIPNRI